MSISGCIITDEIKRFKESNEYARLSLMDVASLEIIEITGTFDMYDGVYDYRLGVEYDELSKYSLGLLKVKYLEIDCDIEYIFKSLPFDCTSEICGSSFKKWLTINIVSDNYKPNVYDVSYSLYSIMIHYRFKIPVSHLKSYFYVDTEKHMMDISDYSHYVSMGILDISGNLLCRIYSSDNINDVSVLLDANSCNLYMTISSVSVIDRFVNYIKCNYSNDVRFNISLVILSDTFSLLSNEESVYLKEHFKVYSKV